MSKLKRAVWWKMFSNQRYAIESLTDEDAGRGLKLAFRYFDGEDIDFASVKQGAFTAFCVMKPYMDEAQADYEKFVADGRKGAEKRWNDNRKPPYSPPIG